MAAAMCTWRGSPPGSQEVPFWMLESRHFEDRGGNALKMAISSAKRGKPPGSPMAFEEGLKGGHEKVT